MALTNTEDLRDEIDKLFRSYIDGIKMRTKCNLNDSAVNGEGFVRNLLNLLYGFNLHRERIESAYNETIDLHNLAQEVESKKVCVQVTARNDKSKVDRTIAAFIKKKKYKLYDELHFFIFDREKSFDYNKNELRQYDTEIEFHDYTTIFRKFCSFDSYESIVPIYNFVQQEIGSPQKVHKIEKQSKTLKSSLKHGLEDRHIIEQLHGILKSFEGLSCIHPLTVSKLWPFTTGDYIYDGYSNFCLKTDNKEIHELLEKIEVNNFKLNFLDESLEPYKDQLSEILTILNRSMIQCICYREKYTEIKHHKVKLIEFKDDCECNYCLYDKFDIKPLFDTLKSKSIEPSGELTEALSEAYYLFKLGETLKSWGILDKVISESDNLAVKFIAEYNMINMYGSINVPWNSGEAKSILPKINEIDIPTLLYSFNTSFELRDELIRIKEDRHLHDSRIKIEELAEKILDTKLLYSKGVGIFLGPSYITQIWNELFILKVYFSSNSLLLDNFFTFRNTVRKGIEAIFNSYTTSKLYKDRYEEFDYFILSLMLECLSESSFEKLLDNTNLTEIKISESAKTKVLFKIKNYFEFQYSRGVFNSLTFYDVLQKQDYFSRFRQELRHLFNKIMMLLSYSNYTIEELMPLTDTILNYVQASEDFNHNNWKYFTRFLDKKIKAFSPNQINLIINQLLIRENHRSGVDQLKNICKIASKIDGFIFENEKEMQKQLKNASEPCSNCNRLHYLETTLACWPVINKKDKELIKQNTIEILLDNFDGQIYQEAAFMGVLTKESNQDLLQKFIDYAADSCNTFDIKQEKGRWIVLNFTGMNALSCIDFMGVSFQDNRLKEITRKSDFYNWVVNMHEYDYSEFDFNWLTDLCSLSFLRKRLQGIEELKIIVKDKLKNEFDRELSDFYVKYMI